MCNWVIAILQKIDIFTEVCKILLSKVFLDPQWLYQSKLKSREKWWRTTAALSTIHQGQRCCTSGVFSQFLFNDSLLQQPLPMQSFRFANQMYVKCHIDVLKGSVTMCMSGSVCVRGCVCACVCVCTGLCGGGGVGGGSVSSVRTAVHTAGVQLPSRGWAGLCWRGQGTEGSASTYPPGWRTGCQAASAAWKYRRSPLDHGSCVSPPQRSSPSLGPCVSPRA